MAVLPVRLMARVPDWFSCPPIARSGLRTAGCREEEEIA